jgi:hypothetical protein
MSTVEAIVIIKRAEQEMRDQLQQALDEGRYVDVAELARLADGLSHLLAAAGVSKAVPSAPASESTPMMPPAELPGRRHPHPAARPGRRVKAFPRFERDADRLVKIAWSKKDRAQYEHKAPMRVVNLLIDAIRSKKGEGSKFTAPDVLPLHDPKSRAEIPSYQSYLALGWLRHEGVIVKYGRDTYSLKPTAATATHLKELWEALPSRD